MHFPLRVVFSFGVLAWTCDCQAEIYKKDLKVGQELVQKTGARCVGDWVSFLSTISGKEEGNENQMTVYDE